MRSLAGVLCLALSIAGCSAGDAGGGRTNSGGDQPNKTGAGGSGSFGTAGGLNVGNNTKPQATTVAPVDTAAQYIDGGVCEVDKFCEPAGADGDCGSLTLKSNVEVTVTPGNLLIVFDQSLSMNDVWQTTTKLEAAKAALVAAITPLQDKLTVGAIFLPTNVCIGPPLLDGAISVAPIEDPSQIAFMPGPQFLAAWDSKWTNMIDLGIGTPLNEAFDQADIALQAGLTSKTLTGKVAVLAFTDGDPNCTTDESLTHIPTKPEPDRAAQWLTQGVQTYMIGLPGAAGVTLLDQIAMSGGTMNYITPDDPMTLANVLKMVIEEQVSMGFKECALDLTPPANPPEKLQLVVTEKGTDENVPHDLPMGGWTVTPDGIHVELTGSLCDDAKGGRFETVKFEYGCKDLPPLPPEQVPD